MGRRCRHFWWWLGQPSSVWFGCMCWLYVKLCCWDLACKHTICDWTARSWGMLELNTKGQVTEGVLLCSNLGHISKKHIFLLQHVLPLEKHQTCAFHNLTPYMSLCLPALFTSECARRLRVGRHLVHNAAARRPWLAFPFICILRMQTGLVWCT